MTEQTEVWRFAIKVKSCSEIPQKHFTSCRGKAVRHSWDTPGLCLVPGHCSPTGQWGQWGLVAPCDAGLVKSLLEEILTVWLPHLFSSSSPQWKILLQGFWEQKVIVVLFHLLNLWWGESHSSRKLRKWSIAFAILCDLPLWITCSEDFYELKKCMAFMAGHKQNDF